MKAKLVELRQLETDVLQAPDQQISLTDPDARAMATSMRGAGVVGYNVQAAVDTEHHLIVAHDVTNLVTDRTLLSPMARLAKEAMVVEKIDYDPVINKTPLSFQSNRIIGGAAPSEYLPS